MKKKDKIKVGISCGDINGVGIEVLLKTFEDKRVFDFCTPILFCNGKVVGMYKKLLELNHVNTYEINNLDKATPNKINILNVFQENLEVLVGEETKDGGKGALLSLEKATEALDDKKIDVLVTAPINKSNIQSDNFKFKGHTEYLESKFEGKSLMILMTEEIRIGLITGHIPISDVSEAISEDLIKSKVDLMYNSLLKDFGISKPKIAVLGLNPHCGDNGVIGDEDDRVIRPTLEKMQNDGKLIYGPYAADSFFGSESYKDFDGVLAMYHDQGLGPFKTMSFGKGVNFTAGLNIVRTSPDHGTAYEIAGQNKANSSSFKEAIFSAIKIYNKREEYLELSKNKLEVKKRIKK